MTLSKTFSYIDENMERFVDELSELLRIPSVSATGEGVNRCAEALRSILEDLGIDSRVYLWEPHPYVFGQLHRSDDLPTILVYGHYDVQPVGDLSEWDSPPFEPTIRDGRLFARGAGDNKGQFFAHLKALESLLAVGKKPPANFKFIFDGAEEQGSPGLAEFVESHEELLTADFYFNADGPAHETGRPTLWFGVKGSLHLSIKADVSRRDAHSAFAPVVPSGAWELVQLLANLRDEEGDVLIPGFYDDVLEPTAEELAVLDRLPAADEATMEEFGLERLAGAPGKSYHEKLIFEPTFNISTLRSGYQGEGRQNVLPHLGEANLDIRLVPDQTPEKLMAKLSDYVQRLGFRDVQLEAHGGFLPARTPVTHPVARAAIDIVEKVTGEEPAVLPGIGASNPSYLFTEVLGLPMVNMAYANPDEANHAPNENLDLEYFRRGIRTSAAIFAHDFRPELNQSN